MSRVLWGGLRTFLVVVLVAAHVVVIGIIGGAFVERSSQQGVDGGISATGTVVSETASCGRGHCFYAPVISFTTATGQREQVTGTDGNGHPVLGSTRKVSYRADDPGDAHVLGHSSEWIGLLIAGVVLAALLVVYDIRRLRGRRSGRLAA